MLELEDSYAKLVVDQNYFKVYGVSYESVMQEFICCRNVIVVRFPHVLWTGPLELVLVILWFDSAFGLLAS